MLHFYSRVGGERRGKGGRSGFDDLHQCWHIIHVKRLRK
jgi:hypothetical protein